MLPSGAQSGSASTLLTRRRLIVTALLAASALAGLYLLAGSLQGFSHTWAKLQSGDPAWLAVAVVLELLSIAGYASLFFAVIGRDAPRIGWRASLQIPLAGIAALRLLATGGAGGFALTAWALGRAGMERRTIGSRMVSGVVVQYAVYMGALVVCGVGLRAGAAPGRRLGGRHAVPALFALGVIVLVLALAALPFDPACSQLGMRLAFTPRRSLPQRPRPLGAERGLDAPRRHSLGARADERAARRPPLGRAARRDRVLGLRRRRALVLLPRLRHRAARSPWWSCPTSSARSPACLPLPGGIGGVEGGMIGVFIAFGVPAGEAVIGVLAYRAISFWLPTLPGIAGYLGLRRTVRGWELANAREARDGGNTAAADALSAAGNGERAAGDRGAFAQRVGEHRAQRGFEAQPQDTAACRQ